MTFDETVLILSRIYNEKSSLLHTQYQCLNLMKKANNYLTYAGIVNREYKRFKMNERDSEIQSCILSYIIKS